MKPKKRSKKSPPKCIDGLGRELPPDVPYVEPDPSTLITLADGATVTMADVTHIAPLYRVFAVPIASLSRDPRNTRLHGDGDLPGTANSLKQFGQQVPIQFDAATRVIKIGNGRHEAAQNILKWKYIAAVPSNLTPAQLKAYAIADNRTAEKSEWDVEELERQLEELSAELPDFAAVDIFTDDELSALADGDFETAHGFAPKPKKEDPPAGEQQYPSVYKIIITCRDEKHQAELIEAFEKRGYEFTTPNVT